MELIATILVILLLLFGEIRLYQRRGLTGLSYGCHFSAGEVTEGDRVQFTETLTNDKGFPVPWLKAELTVPRWLEFPDSDSTVTDALCFVTGFFSLRSHARVSRVRQVCCTKRGIYQVEHVSIVTSDLLGILRMTLTGMETGDTVTVLPRRFSENGLILPRLFRQDAGAHPAPYGLWTDPCLPAGVQEYTMGDPLNRIHWKASAHMGQLMVRQEERTAKRSVTVLLSLETNGLNSGMVTRDNGLMEHTIRVCAQCLWELCRDGCMVRLCVGEMDLDGVLYASPWGGGEQMYHHMLEMLAALPLKEIVPTAQLLRQTRRSAESALLIAPCTEMIVGAWKAETGGMVIMTGHHRDYGSCADLEVCET